MVKRRTLDEGLTPEEEVFYKPEKAASAPVKKTAAAGKNAARKPAASPEKAKDPVQQIELPVFTGNPHAAGVVTLNTRLPAELDTALLTASMHRKIQGRHPFTKQDIVAEALTEWLKKNNFLH